MGSGDSGSANSPSAARQEGNAWIVLMVRGADGRSEARHAAEGGRSNERGGDGRVELESVL